MEISVKNGLFSSRDRRSRSGACRSDPRRFPIVAGIAVSGIVLVLASCVSAPDNGGARNASLNSSAVRPAAEGRAVKIERVYETQDRKAHYDFLATWNLGPTGLGAESEKRFLEHLRTQAIQSLGYREGRAVPASLAQRADQGLSEFKNFLSANTKTDGDRSIAWYERVHAFLESAPKGFASARIEYEGFQGGAHPIAMRTWVNVDAKGNLLRYENVLPSEAARTAVSAYAESMYREARKLAPDARLELFGVAQGQDFPLSASFGLTARGLILYYNYYEIEPYVFGPFSILVPASFLTEKSPVW